MQIYDDLGRTLVLNRTPERIISVVPSLTELLCDLELESKIVGRTKFCIHPKSYVSSIPKVGGTKNLNIKKIMSLNPNLILADKEENSKEDIEALTSLTNVYVSDIRTIKNAIHTIQQIGTIHACDVRAAQLIQEIEDGFNKIKQALHSKSQIRVCYLIWKEPYMTVGADTYIHDVLETVGFKNVFGMKQRYPIVTSIEIAEASPDIIMLSTEPYPFKSKHRDKIVASIPYIKNRVVIIDGEMFSWYGSRMRKATIYLGDLYAKLKQGQIPVDGLMLPS